MKLENYGQKKCKILLSYDIDDYQNIEEKGTETLCYVEKSMQRFFDVQNIAFQKEAENILLEDSIIIYFEFDDPFLPYTATNFYYYEKYNIYARKTINIELWDLSQPMYLFVQFIS